MSRSLAETDLAALCRGDNAAWGSFIPLATGVIRSVAWRVLSSSGNEQEVQDVVQEVFARLSGDGFRLLRSYDASRASLSTWLGVVTTGASIDWLRRKRQYETPIDLVPEDQLGVAELVMGGNLKLPQDMLSPRQALILTLLYEHDLTPEEVAGMLHIEAQTVRSQRHKAFARLRTLWQDQF